MTTARRRGLLAVVTGVGLLALGAGVAVAVGDALGIRTEVAELQRYDGDIDDPALNLTAAQLGVERTDRDLAMAWLARVLLVFAVAWVVIGMVASRTRLVRRPDAAAARAAWLGATRPWRARESTLGMLPLD